MNKISDSRLRFTNNGNTRKRLTPGVYLESLSATFTFFTEKGKISLVSFDNLFSFLFLSFFFILRLGFRLSKNKVLKGYVVLYLTG